MGELFASLTALFWAGAVILIKRSGETLPPLALNLFRVAVSSVLLLVTMLVLGQAPWRAAPTRDYLLIIASGVIAIAVADTLWHASLNRIGATLSSITSSFYPPLTAIFAYLILGERLTTGDLVGMALVTSAVVVASRTAPLPGASHRTVVVGVLLGVVAMAALSLGIVMVKPVLSRQPVVWVTGMRQFVALAVLLLMALHPRQRAACRGLLRLPRRTFRFALSGTVMGSYLALIFWVAGMKYTNAGTAAILNQTSIIYVILLARLILKEPLTWRKLAASVLAAAGIVAVIRGW